VHEVHEVHDLHASTVADYVAKISNPNVRGIAQVRIVPEPNLHLDYMTKTVFKLSEAFYGRPTMLVTIDEPLFITCDEPVILVTNGDQSHVRHLPTCFESARRRAKDARKPSRNRRRKADTSMSTRPGRVRPKRSRWHCHSRHGRCSSSALGAPTAPSTAPPAEPRPSHSPKTSTST